MDCLRVLLVSCKPSGCRIASLSRSSIGHLMSCPVKCLGRCLMAVMILGAAGVWGNPKQLFWAICFADPGCFFVEMLECLRKLWATSTAVSHSCTVRWVGLEANKVRKKRRQLEIHCYVIIYPAAHRGRPRKKWRLQLFHPCTMLVLDAEDHRPVTLEALMVLGPQHSLLPMPSREDPEVKEMGGDSSWWPA